MEQRRGSKEVGRQRAFIEPCVEHVEQFVATHSIQVIAVIADNPAPRLKFQARAKCATTAETPEPFPKPHKTSHLSYRGFCAPCAETPVRRLLSVSDTVARRAGRTALPETDCAVNNPKLPSPLSPIIQTPHANPIQQALSNSRLSATTHRTYSCPPAFLRVRLLFVPCATTSTTPPPPPFSPFCVPSPLSPIITHRAPSPSFVIRHLVSPHLPARQQRKGG